MHKPWSPPLKSKSSAMDGYQGEPSSPRAISRPASQCRSLSERGPPTSPIKRYLLSLSRRQAAIGVLSAAALSTTVSSGAHAQAVQLVAVDMMTVGQGYQVSKLIGKSAQNDKDE